MTDCIGTLLGISSDNAEFIVNELKAILTKNNIDTEDFLTTLDKMTPDDLGSGAMRMHTKTYMLLRVYLKIKIKQLRAIEIDDRRNEFYRKQDIFNDDGDNSDFLSESGKRDLLLSYQLKKLRPITVPEDGDKIKYILDYFTPLIFPIVEDNEWEVLTSTTELHRIPDNTVVYVNSLPKKYNEYKIDQWMDEMIQYFEQYVDPRIQYSIQRDEVFKMNWIYIIKPLMTA